MSRSIFFVSPNRTSVDKTGAARSKLSVDLVRGPTTAGCPGRPVSKEAAAGAPGVDLQPALGGSAVVEALLKGSMMSALVYAMPLTVALAKVTSMLDFSGTRLWSISVSAWGGRVVGGTVRVVPVPPCVVDGPPVGGCVVGGTDGVTTVVGTIVEP